MYLETRSKFYDSDFETAVIKMKQKSLSKLESQIIIKMVKYCSQALADTNKVWYRKSPTDMNVQHQYGVVQHQNWTEVLLQDAEY